MLKLLIKSLIIILLVGAGLIETVIVGTKISNNIGSEYVFYVDFLVKFCLFAMGFSFIFIKLYPDYMEKFTDKYYECLKLIKESNLDVNKVLSNHKNKRNNKVLFLRDSLLLRVNPDYVYNMALEDMSKKQLKSYKTKYVRKNNERFKNI